MSALKMIFVLFLLQVSNALWFGYGYGARRYGGYYGHRYGYWGRMLEERTEGQLNDQDEEPIHIEDAVCDTYCLSEDHDMHVVHYEDVAVVTCNGAVCTGDIPP